MDQPDIRPQAEIDAWMAKDKDPIDRLIADLSERQGQLDDAELEAMQAEVLASIKASVAFAEASPFPALESALEDVFAE